jgi:hypothetical protein
MRTAPLPSFDLRLSYRLQILEIDSCRYCTPGWAHCHTEWHLSRCPEGFYPVVSMFDDPHRWGEMHQPRAFLSALRKCKPNTVEFVGVPAVHQVLAVTPGNTEASKFPERIRALFGRLCGGTPQMHDDDAILRHLSYSSREALRPAVETSRRTSLHSGRPEERRCVECSRF